MQGHIAVALPTPADGAGLVVWLAGAALVGLCLTHTQADHRTLKLCERCQLGEEQLPGRRVHIDPQVQDVNTDAESLPLLQGGGRIYQGSEAPIHLGECDGIPRLDEIPQLLPPGSLLEGDLAGDILIYEHPAHLHARLLSELTQPDRLGIGRCLLIIR
jgi:hypothetical protein